jgi:hypothetical protein
VLQQQPNHSIAGLAIGSIQARELRLLGAGGFHNTIIA